jgi:uncharacterized protein (DUF1697 family)
MQTYLALLRGVNVGASNRIKMEELRRAMEAYGFLNVETYIQSGNVLFDSDQDEQTLVARLESLLQASFEYRGAVVLRTKSELAHLIDNLPFSSEEVAAAESVNAGAESLYVCLYPALPVDFGQRLNKVDSTGDRFAITGRDVYLLLRQSIRLSKLAIALQKPSDRGTARNWNTMLALHRLAENRNKTF